MQLLTASEAARKINQPSPARPRNAVPMGFPTTSPRLISGPEASNPSRYRARPFTSRGRDPRPPQFPCSRRVRIAASAIAGARRPSRGGSGGASITAWPSPTKTDPQWRLVRSDSPPIRSNGAACGIRSPIPDRFARRFQDGAALRASSIRHFGFAGLGGAPTKRTRRHRSPDPGGMACRSTTEGHSRSSILRLGSSGREVGSAHEIRIRRGGREPWRHPVVFFDFLSRRRRATSAENG